MCQKCREERRFLEALNDRAWNAHIEAKKLLDNRLANGVSEKEKATLKILSEQSWKGYDNLRNTITARIFALPQECEKRTAV